MKQFFWKLSPTKANFRKLCDEVERQFPTAKKAKLLVDVDGSLIQPYDTPQGHLTVICSFDEFDEALYISSTFETGIRV